MSGHNKWSKIKNKKGAADSKRAKEFTKLARAITVASKEGGENPDYNASLKQAIDKAKAINMPNDNIMRAIKKGSSSSSDESYETVVYEGYGPSGIAVIVECLTDNRNRTAPEVRHAFDKFGGNMGTTGSVSFMFNRRGVIVLDIQGLDAEEVTMDVLDFEVEDLDVQNDTLEVQTAVENFMEVKNGLEAKGYKFIAFDLMYIPTNYQEVTDEKDVTNLEKMIDALEDNDDVQNVYHNWDNDDEE